MRNLVDFLKRHNHWLVFIALETISIVLLFRYNNYQGSVWFSTANSVAGKVYEWSSGITQYFALKDVNSQLAARNIYLERQTAIMAEKLQRQENDSAFAQRLRQQTLDGLKLVKAKVVSSSLDKADNFLTIDKGTADGVQKDMGVVGGNGVVGIVYLAGPHYSVVIPVIHSQSNISCMIKNRGYFGYLHWTGGATDVAYVDDVPRHARFRGGDAIVTSGYSSVFPPGILVGTIVATYNSSDGLSYRLKVKLSTDFGCLRDVAVIADDAMAERMKVLQAAQDSIKPKTSH